MSKIFVLSGPIQTGKTTRLSEWVNSQTRIDGILAPLIKGERHLLHIASLESHSLENTSDIKDQIRIGRFIFSRDVFLWARERLTTIDGSSIDWLILDEIGPLELEGKGLELAISSLLKKFNSLEINILFVIREGLVQKVIEHYLLNMKEVKPFTFP